MLALVYQSKVMQIQEQSFPVHPNFQWIECDQSVKVGDGWDGEHFIPQAVPVKTIEEVLREYTDALQAFMDNKAREKQYDNSISIVTYVSSTNEQWKAEADTFVLWRDAVYVYALGVLNAVEQGGEQPTIEEFLTGLPALVWPQ